MKTNFEYSDSMTALITTKYGNVYEMNFSHTTLQKCVEWATAAIDFDEIEIPSVLISQIMFVSSTTGEILLECSPEYDEPTKFENENYLPPFDFEMN